MFRCQMCQQVAPAGTRAAKLTVSTRRKVYASRGPAPSERRFRRGPQPKRKDTDKGGSGVEIVQELSVCPACAAKHASAEPTMVGGPVEDAATPEAVDVVEPAGGDEDGAE